MPTLMIRSQPELEATFNRSRAKLRRMVEFRLDRRVQSRVDPSDVVQDAFLEAVRRLDSYRAKPDMPPFLWLRFLVGERILQLHRQHLGTQRRGVEREVSLYGGPLPMASSAAIAAQLVGNLTSPSQVAERAERLLKLQEALNAMDEIDREVLSLRHFEHLTNAEAAQALGIDQSAASNRYVRALKRLKQILTQMTS